MQVNCTHAEQAHLRILKTDTDKETKRERGRERESVREKEREMKRDGESEMESLMLLKFNFSIDTTKLKN